MGFSVGLDLGALAGGAMQAGAGIVQGYWNKNSRKKISIIKKISRPIYLLVRTLRCRDVLRI